MLAVWKHAQFTQNSNKQQQPFKETEENGGGGRISNQFSNLNHHFKKNRKGMTTETIDKKRANKEAEIMKSEKHNRMKILIS